MTTGKNNWRREGFRPSDHFSIHARDYVQHRKRLKVTVCEFRRIQVGDHWADGDDSSKISGKKFASQFHFSRRNVQPLNFQRHVSASVDVQCFAVGRPLR